MTSYVIRRRDQRRRERMIDEAVRRVRAAKPLRFELMALREALGSPLLPESLDEMAEEVRAEFRRLASR